MARITYNSKTIDLDKPRAIYIDPFVPRTINTTLTGDTEIVYLPRVDVNVRATFAKETSSTLRLQLHEWWQWAQKGGQFRFVFDTAKTVKTTLSAQEAAGQTILSVTSVTGFVAGQQYVVIGGPNYQLVQIDSVGASTITITSSLNATFASGSVVRDQYLWDGIIRNRDQRTPIRDLFDPELFGTFEFTLDFFEDVA